MTALKAFTDPVLGQAPSTAKLVIDCQVAHVNLELQRILEEILEHALRTVAQPRELTTFIHL